MVVHKACSSLLIPHFRAAYPQLSLSSAYETCNNPDNLQTRMPTTVPHSQVGTKMLLGGHLRGIQGDEQSRDGVLHGLGFARQRRAEAAKTHELRHNRWRPHLCTTTWTHLALHLATSITLPPLPCLHLSFSQTAGVQPARD